MERSIWSSNEDIIIAIIITRYYYRNNILYIVEFWDSKGHFTHETITLQPLSLVEEPMGITLQALSLVEEAEPVRVRYFTLVRLRDQRSVWMQGGCKVYVDLYVAFNGSCFMVTWTISINCLLEVGLTNCDSQLLNISH